MRSAVDYSKIPSRLISLCQRLQGKEFAAYLVGGGVRDLLLDRPVHDWDVATSARPEEVSALFRKTIPTGIQHGTVTVLLAPGFGVEVTTFRGEGAYSDGRHPDSVVFVRTIEEDLSRRDFTINAMALDPLSQEIVDPFGGAADLEREVIRAVGDPLARFGEDGLRPLRAVRFAATLRFEIEEQTLAAIGPSLEKFRLVSAERVRDELLKLLEAPSPSVGLELMRRSGLLVEVLPELLPGLGMEQNRFHTEDVYYHSLHVCDGATGDAILRLAALLHDVGKAGTMRPNDHPGREGENTFHGHAREGAELCEEIGRRLKISNEQRERLCHLVAHHMFPLDGWTPAGLRRLLRRAGTATLPDLFVLAAADLRAKGSAEDKLQKLEALRSELQKVAEEKPVLQTHQLALDGRAVMKHLGISPGPIVGELLHELLERVIEDPSLNTEHALLGLLDELGKSWTETPE